MPSLFSTTKNTLFIGLSLILSSSLIQADDTCWINAYGRGVGKVISVCAEGLEQGGALCYPPCESGYNGVGPVCWQECPDGFTNTGIDCLKPSAYGRGTGYFLWHEDECEQENPQGCEKYGALYYPKCKDGYYAFGCCICSPDCPNDMTDIGVSCQKKSYGRTAGVPLVCASGLEEDAGLCYPPCKDGYKGVGPVCWQQCPSNMYQCGALCTPTADDCTADMLSIADQILEAMNSDAEDEDGMIEPEDTGSDFLDQLGSIPMCSK